MKMTCTFCLRIPFEFRIIYFLKVKISSVCPRQRACLCSRQLSRRFLPSPPPRPFTMTKFYALNVFTWISLHHWHLIPHLTTEITSPTLTSILSSKRFPLREPERDSDHLTNILHLCRIPKKKAQLSACPVLIRVLGSHYLPRCMEPPLARALCIPTPLHFFPGKPYSSPSCPLAWAKVVPLAKDANHKRTLPSKFLLVVYTPPSMSCPREDRVQLRPLSQAPLSGADTHQCVPFTSLTRVCNDLCTSWFFAPYLIAPSDNKLCKGGSYLFLHSTASLWPVAQSSHLRYICWVR